MNSINFEYKISDVLLILSVMLS